MSKYNDHRWRSLEVRMAKSGPKDSVTVDILKSLKITKDFSAIMMPCLHGIELAFLEQAGVSKKRMFAIERTKESWKEMKKADRIRLTPRPMDAHKAIDFIEAEHRDGFDFIYGDFLGVPDFTHFDFLYKIFKLKMVKPGGKLLLTFGKSRCRRIISQFNAMLRRIDGRTTVPTQRYVDAAIERAEHPKYKWLVEHPYKTSTGRIPLTYVATEVQF